MGFAIRIWNDDSIPLCCTSLAVNFFVDHSLISTESCLSSDLTIQTDCNNMDINY